VPRPKVAFGGEKGQRPGQFQLVCNDWKLVNLESQFFRGTCPDGIVELPQSFDLIDDGLLLGAPYRLLL
jgi:hypothetical protein